MINFVDIPLQDPNYLDEHDRLDLMLSEGWQIIGHAVYTCKNLDYLDDAYERFTLYKADKPQDISLIERLIDAETIEEKENIYLEIGKHLMPEGSSS